MRRSGNTLAEVMVIVSLALLFVCLLFAPRCFIDRTDEREARRVLGAHGFTAIEFTGFQVWGCSRYDLQHTGFRARGVNGSVVDGVVCCGGSEGCGKACTVRLR